MRNNVIDLYIATFQRAPDPEGLEFWLAQMDEEGLDLAAVASNMFLSAEAQEQYGGLDDEALITTLYNNLFDREPDAEGLAYWLGEIASGAMTREDAVANLVGGARAETGDPIDAAILNARFEAALEFVNNTTQEEFDADPDAAAAVVRNITRDQFENGELPPSVDGSTFVLTEMPGSWRLIDDINITDGFGPALNLPLDPTWVIREKVAPVLTPDEKNEGVLGSGLTSSGNDRIITDAYGLHGAVVDAGGGNNELRVEMKGPFAQPTLLTNIQTITVTNLANVYNDANRDIWGDFNLPNPAASILDLSRALDIESLIINEGTVFAGGLTVWNIQNGAGVTLEGNFSQLVQLDFAGGLDAVDLTFNNARDIGGFNLQLSHNAGQVNLTSEGRLNVVDVTTFGLDLDTLNIAGDARLILNSPLAFRNDLPIELDASASTGGVTLAVNLSGNGGHNTGVVNLQGGSGNDAFTLTGFATVGASNTNAITLTADMGAGSDQIAFASAGLRVLDGSTIDGEEVALLVQSNVNLSGANDLFAEGADISVLLNNFTTVTLNQAQYDDIGAENFSLASVSVNPTATIALQVTEDFDADTLDPAALADGIALGLNIANGVELTITGDQFVALATNGVTFTGLGDLVVEGLTQENVASLEDWAAADGNALTFAVGFGFANIFRDFNTGVSMTLAEDVTFTDDNGAGPTVLGNVAFDLDGNTLTLQTVGQASGLEVTNGAIVLDFVGFAGVSLNMSDYTDISNIQVYEALVANNTNIESLFLNLASSVEEIRNLIDVVETPIDLLDQDRIVNVFEGVTMSGAELQFVTPNASDNDNVQTVVLNLLGDATVTGDVIVDLNPTKAGSLQSITINSMGSEANTITGGVKGDGTTFVPNVGFLPFAGGDLNDVLDVTINAGANLAIEQDIVFTSQTGGATATLTLTGDADVTVKEVVAGLNVTSIVYDTTDYTGSFVQTGGSEALSGDVETLTFEGTGDVLIGTPDVADDAVDSWGVNAPELSSVNAAEHEGALTIVFGEVNGDSFSFTGGTGVNTIWMSEIGSAPALSSPTLNADGEWSFDLSGAAAGSALRITDDVDLSNGGDLTLNLGVAQLQIAGNVDFRLLDSLVFEGADPVIFLEEGATVQMTAEQFTAFEAAGGTINGDTVLAVTQDLIDDIGANLTDVRGATELQIDNGLSVTVTGEQALISRVFDDADPAELGELGALGDATVNVWVSEDIDLTPVSGMNLLRMLDTGDDETFITVQLTAAEASQLASKTTVRNNEDEDGNALDVIEVPAASGDFIDPDGVSFFNGGEEALDPADSYVLSEVNRLVLDGDIVLSDAQLDELFNGTFEGEIVKNGNSVTAVVTSGANLAQYGDNVDLVELVDGSGNVTLSVAQAYAARVWDVNPYDVAFDVDTDVGERGELDGYADQITVVVEGDADLRGLTLAVGVGTDVIQVQKLEDLPEVAVTEDQLSNLEVVTDTDPVTVSQLGGDIAAGVSELTVSVSVRTGDDAEGEPIVETRDIVITNDDGTITAEAHALALAAAQNGAQFVVLNELLAATESTQVNFVGTTPFLEQGESLNALDDASAFTFSFVSGTVANAEGGDFTEITNFQAGDTEPFDVLDFSGVSNFAATDFVSTAAAFAADEGDLVLFTGTGGTDLLAGDISNIATFEDTAFVVVQDVAGADAGIWAIVGNDDGAVDADLIQIAGLTFVDGAFVAENFGIA